MTYLATLTISSGQQYQSGVSGAVFNFATAEFDPPGMAIDQLADVHEELTDNGIDGRRWRKLSRQFQEFTLSTTADSASWAGAMALQRSYIKAINRIADLSASLADTSYRWKNVKIKGCIPNLKRGVMVGNGATANSTAVLYAKWTLILTNLEGTQS